MDYLDYRVKKISYIDRLTGAVVLLYPEIIKAIQGYKEKSGLRPVFDKHGVFKYNLYAF